MLPPFDYQMYYSIGAERLVIPYEVFIQNWVGADYFIRRVGAIHVGSKNAKTNADPG
jgi:hypothetical protein